MSPYPPVEQDASPEPRQRSVSRHRLKPHRGTTVLVLGILGLVCCAILGIIAWVMGNNDLREMDRGRMDPRGRDITNAGKICGIISVALWIAGTLIYAVVIGLAASTVSY